MPAGRGRTGAVDRAVLATMRPAGVAAAVVSAIADLPMIRRDPATKRLEKVRDPDPGECLACVEGYLDSFAAAGMRIAREPDEIRAGACPGADRGTPPWCWRSRAATSWKASWIGWTRWRRAACAASSLTHYLVNETGDVQTAPPVHGGLTAFGADAVRRMNRLGVIVDVAHCSEATVKGVARVATRPFLCSHANLKEPGHPDGDHPRYLSPDYARMVVESGGVIGAWIAVLWRGGTAGDDPAPVPTDRRGRGSIMSASARTCPPAPR